jgi:hypothetical protein
MKKFKSARKYHGQRARWYYEHKQYRAVCRRFDRLPRAGEIIRRVECVIALNSHNRAYGRFDVEARNRLEGRYGVPVMYFMYYGPRGFYHELRRVESEVAEIAEMEEEESS